jgi:pimeloyl-ACP methyl ester carboxylesterase
LLLLSGYSGLAQNKQPGVRNIVLVHGAWADGSGWKGVYDNKVEVPGASHAVYVSRPKEVAALIEQAASHTR